MVKVEKWQDPELSEAILIWTGHGESISPLRDRSIIEQRFGSNANNWMTLIESLVDEFYKTNANLEAENMQEMWESAIADFDKKYPDAPKEITAALAWCYTFDNR